MPPKKKIKVAGNQQKITFFTGQQSQSDKPNESAEDKLPEERNFHEKKTKIVRLVLKSMLSYSVRFITGVIWYFDPHGILTLGSLFRHCILNPLMVY
jgi:hypothetical protein